MRTFRIEVVLIAIVLALTMPVACEAQFRIFTANAQPLDPAGQRWKISSTITTVAKEEVTNVTLLDATNGKIVDYADKVFFDRGNTGKATGLWVTSAPMDSSLTYLLIITVIEKNNATGSFQPVTDSHNVSFATLSRPTAPAPAPGGGAGTAKTRTILKAAKSSAKKDSDFYFAGEIVKTSGGDAIYTGEIKIEPRFGRGHWTYSPFYNINLSSDPEADPDTMNLGFKATRSIPFDYEASDNWQLRLTSLYLSLGGKIEAERDFDNANAIFDPRATFAVGAIPLGKKVALYIDPFVGAEIGKNLKSPLPAAESEGVARIFGGVSTLLDVPVGKGIEQITFSGDWTRRWLLKKELGFKVNDDKTLSLAEFGRGPRDFVETKLEFGVNKFLNPYIGYEWGQAPPSYKLVDHKFVIGFSYKFKLTTRE